MKKITLIVLLIFCFGILSFTCYAVENTATEKALKCTITFLKAPQKDKPIYGGVSINGYDYYKYKFQKGDIIEYEVYLDTNIPGIGYIDVQNSKPINIDQDGWETHDWRFLRPGKEHPDQAIIKDEQGIDYDFKADLSAVAYKKWYKRKISVPDYIAEGYSSRHWSPYAYASLELTDSGSQTAIVYYRNIRVTGKDGEVKQIIFDDKEKFISADLYDVNGVKIEVEETSNFPGSKQIISSKANSTNSVDNKTINNRQSLFVLIIVIIIVVILIIILSLLFINKRKKG